MVTFYPVNENDKRQDRKQPIATESLLPDNSLAYRQIQELVGIIVGKKKNTIHEDTEPCYSSVLTVCNILEYLEAFSPAFEAPH